MRLINLACSLFLALTAFGTDWYVDSAASGAMNGTSWTDAWTNSADIVWGSISAGDTVYFDGGSTSKRYTDGLAPTASGAVGNPIYVKPSREAGRNGLVSIKGFSTGSCSNIVVDGSKSDVFVIPQSVTDMHDITNNIGLQFGNRTDGVSVYATRMQGITIRWVDILGAPPPLPGGINDYSTIYLNSPSVVQGNTIEYCWVRYATQYGIGNNGASAYDADSWTNLLVHHCVFENHADDNIIVSFPGLTIHDNIFGPKRPDYSAGHPDSLQVLNATLANWRTYNNIIFNPRNSWIWITMGASEGGVTGNIEFYGNVLHLTQGWSDRSAMNYGAQISAWGASAPVESTIYTNIYVVNNTYYRAPTFSQTVTKRTVNAGHELWNVVVTNAVIKNNLILDSGKTEAGSLYQSGVLAIAGPGWTDYSSTNGMFYTTNEVLMDYNVIWGPVEKIAYGGTTYNTPEDFNAAGYFVNNSSSAPSLVDTNNADFRLTSDDTTCLDQGEDLSALVATLPGLDRDLWGTLRGYGSSWDIGANEYNPGTLIMQLDFEDQFGDGVCSDATGNGNDGNRWGYYGVSDTSSNFPSASVVTNNATVSQGAYFNYYWDSYDGYGRTGDYLVVTNIAEGTSVSNLTVALWARYDTATDTGGNPAPWTTDHNATLIDNGKYQTAGSWRIGKENYWSGAIYNNQTKLTLWTDTTVANRVQLTFGDSCDSHGATTPAQMNHYAWVFDNGTNYLYLNGALAATNISSQTTLQLDTDTHWLGIGAWPHAGSVSSDPWLTNAASEPLGYDVYPNTFWFKGWMDDIRIYEESLSQSQVQAIYGTVTSDTTPPQLGLAEVDVTGDNLDLTFNENVTQGAGGSGGWVLSPSGGAVNLTDLQGSNGEWSYHISRTIDSSETLTVSYTQPTDGWQDLAGNELASITDMDVTNNVPASSPTPKGFVIAHLIHKDAEGTFEPGTPTTSELWTTPDRIPLLYLAPDNKTLLAFAENRIDAIGNSGYINVVMKRSLDWGETWSSQEIIATDSTNTYSVGAIVTDSTLNRMFLFVGWNLYDDTEAEIVAGTGADTRHIYLTYSDDNGYNWSTLTDITSSVKAAGWRWYAPGPAQGIELDSGRLLVPFYHTDASTDYFANSVYSDDHGSTWSYGGSVSDANYNECVFAELNDGTVLMNVRNDASGDRRGITDSSDEGATWGSVTNQTTLLDPGCQGSLIIISRQPETSDRMLFSNPANTSVLSQGTVRISYDNGETWAYSNEYQTNLFGYSSLLWLPNGLFGMLYENGTGGGTYYDKISFMSQTLSNLTSGADTWTN